MPRAINIEKIVKERLPNLRNKLDMCCSPILVRMRFGPYNGHYATEYMAIVYTAIQGLRAFISNGVQFCQEIVSQMVNIMFNYR